MAFPKIFPGFKTEAKFSKDELGRTVLAYYATIIDDDLKNYVSEMIQEQIEKDVKEIVENNIYPIVRRSMKQIIKQLNDN